MELVTDISNREELIRDGKLVMEGKVARYRPNDPEWKGDFLRVAHVYPVSYTAETMAAYFENQEMSKACHAELDAIWNKVVSLGGVIDDADVEPYLTIYIKKTDLPELAALPAVREIEAHPRVYWAQREQYYALRGLRRDDNTPRQDGWFKRAVKAATNFSLAA